MQDHRTIVVADHHKTVFVSRVIDRETGEIRSKTLGSTRAELRPFLRELECPAIVYIEACRSWEWVSDLCHEEQIDFRLIDPAKMPEIWKSTKKTDELDVEAMVCRVQLQGELPESYGATKEERDLRSLVRRLGDIRVQRRKLLNQIHAVIDANGLPATKENFVKEAWRDEMQEELTELAWLDLHVLLSSYDHALSMAELIEQRLEMELKGVEDYERLQEIPGVGPILAATILAESAGIERFKDARNFAAFTGLVPRVRSSAGKAKIGQITRSGPPLLRWALCQAVMIGSRASDQTEVSRMYYRKRKKKAPRVAACAAGHKLARIVYSMLVNKMPFRAKGKPAA